MVTGRTWLFVAIGTFVALGGLAAGCDTSSDPTTTASTIADTPSSGSTSAQATTATQAPVAATVQLAFSGGGGSDCTEVVFVTRSIAPGSDPMAAAFELLVAGPTADEVNAGASSSFSDATAASVESVTLAGDLLTVGFEDIRSDMNNASTACGSEALLAQLNGTAFQFAAVERVTYAINGNCGAFFNWLQRDCEILARQ